jgi:hypothetical protein
MCITKHGSENVEFIIQHMNLVRGTNLTLYKVPQYNVRMINKSLQSHLYACNIIISKCE